MAAYAAVVSLMNTMDQIQNHPRLSTSLDEKQIESLREDMDVLLDFIQSIHSHGGSSSSKEAELLERRIARAAYAVEDVIESHIADQIHLGSTKIHPKKRPSVSSIANPSSFSLCGLQKLIKRKAVTETTREIDSIEKTISLFDLKNVIVDMDLVKDKVVAFRDEMGLFKDVQQPTHQSSSAPPTTTASTLSDKSSMVGFDDDLLRLMDWLTGQQSCLQIIPIVGMGGIGKTTLARNVYDHLTIVQHFDFRAWVTISHNYTVYQILNELLAFLKKQEGNENLEASSSDNHELLAFLKKQERNENLEASSSDNHEFLAFLKKQERNENLEASSSDNHEDRLGEKLYKSLFGKRYLIVLDDIWSINAWEQIKFYFPDNNSSSRIVITTRLSNVAIHFGSLRLDMNFLNQDQSWNLFCEKAFAGEGCPSELERIGKRIVQKCRGLPLAIVVIGGLLGKSHKTRVHFEIFGNDISSILSSTERDKHCLDILSLSYRHLPVHLKPCFLYMGIFKEDKEIRLSRLIKLWVAEGFLKPKEAQSLENTAESYFKDLVDRNLIIVHKWGMNGKIKTCIIHDLLRDLCLREAKKEKFFYVKKGAGIPQDIERRVLCYGEYGKTYHPIATRALSSSLTRSLVWEKLPLQLDCRLLRVLRVVGTNSLDDVFRQFNLRYLDYKGVWISIPELPSSMSLLWNMQTLVITESFEQFVAPSEIWEMTRLRHLEIKEIFLPDPPPSSDGQDAFVLRNLQTLLKVVNLKLSKEVCKRIPNVKKLKMKYDDFSCSPSCDYCLNNLNRLKKLESLSCYFKKMPKEGDFLQNITFPSSLKKLVLSNTNLHWEDLTMIGSLPNLEILKLEDDSVSGSEWNPIEGEFVQLKLLKISMCSDLIYWNADSSHFPVLKKLVLEGLSKLDEIPLDVGEIATLELISLDKCSESAAISTMRILEEQENLGNESLHVRVKFLNKAKLEVFKKRVELDCFISSNIELTHYTS